jgi:hypothetical protein
MNPIPKSTDIGVKKEVSIQTTHTKLDMKHQRTTVTSTKQPRPIHAEHKRSDSIVTTALRVLDFFHDFMIVDVIDENAKFTSLKPIKNPIESNGIKQTIRNAIFFNKGSLAQIRMSHL